MLFWGRRLFSYKSFLQTSEIKKHVGTSFVFQPESVALETAHAKELLNGFVADRIDDGERKFEPAEVSRAVVEVETAR